MAPPVPSVLGPTEPHPTARRLTATAALSVVRMSAPLWAGGLSRWFRCPVISLVPFIGAMRPARMIPGSNRRAKVGPPRRIWIRLARFTHERPFRLARLPEEPGRLRGHARHPATGRATSWSRRPSDAEVIVVNTCAFIGPAKQESIDTILEMAELQGSGHVQDAGGDRLPLAALRRASWRRRCPRSTTSSAPARTCRSATCSPPRRRRGRSIPDPDYIPTTRRRRSCSSMPEYTAYLKISEGCDNACAFCIIPKLRGAQRSRPIDDIVREAAGAGRQPAPCESEPRRAGPDRLRPRPPRPPKLHELLRGAGAGRRALDSPALRLPAACSPTSCIEVMAT